MSAIPAPRRHALPFVVVALVGVGGTRSGEPAPLTPNATTLAAIDGAMEAYRLDAHIPGMVWGVVKDGALVHVHGAGVQDVDARRPVTPPGNRRAAPCR